MLTGGDILEGGDTPHGVERIVHIAGQLFFFDHEEQSVGFCGAEITRGGEGRGVLQREAGSTGSGAIATVRVAATGCQYIGSDGSVFRVNGSDGDDFVRGRFTGSRFDGGSCRDGVDGCGFTGSLCGRDLGVS